MKNKISEQLAAKLSHLDSNQLEQIAARAKQLRQRTKGKGDSFHEPLDTWILRVIRKDEREMASSHSHQEGVVTGASTQTCTVEIQDRSVTARLMSQSVVVGDIVTIGQGSSDDWKIVEVKPRKTKLSRPDVHEAEKERVIVANVDTIVIVISVGSPPLHPRLIDRYLVAIEQGGARPLICLNKVDLLQDAAELEVLQPYIDLGITVIKCSALGRNSTDELRQAISGQTCAFVGHSGVGKSSLVNSLKPEAGLETGLVSATYGRGTHTTTASSLHRLTDGTVLIDTPGIRSFGLSELSKSDLLQYFPEFEGLVCRFKNCQHTSEPGCAIREARETGVISEARFDSYLRLAGEAPD